jgi:hypothetical protein
MHALHAAGTGKPENKTNQGKNHRDPHRAAGNHTGREGGAFGRLSDSPRMTTADSRAAAALLPAGQRPGKPAFPGILIPGNAADSSLDSPCRNHYPPQHPALAHTTHCSTHHSHTHPTAALSAHTHNPLQHSALVDFCMFMNTKTGDSNQLQQ